MGFFDIYFAVICYLRLCRFFFDVLNLPFSVFSFGWTKTCLCLKWGLVAVMCFLITFCSPDELNWIFWSYSLILLFFCSFFLLFSTCCFPLFTNPGRIPVCVGSVRPSACLSCLYWLWSVFWHLTDVYHGVFYWPWQVLLLLFLCFYPLMPRFLCFLCVELYDFCTF